MFFLKTKRNLEKKIKLKLATNSEYKNLFLIIKIKI